ncbi:MAG: alpha-2-macroglobulin family protein, partial [Deltaproteobacteria bacterium]|nr:alpha-2-macroglobulin family protein [Deltaproteobacteria bacterium]
GTPLHIAWTTGAPTKLAVFAVDEGILQVARWKEPDPLAYLFRKRALAVTTAQILDLLLPELDIVRALAAPGGDEDALLAGNLNPFKRKGQPPVAYWSGIMDVPAGAGALDYVVPDYFNGTLRVTAVAVNDRAIGVTGAKVISRGPFVINPTLPLFAAPGDEFDTTAIVTNTLEGSGAGVPVQVTLEPSAGLELVGDAAQTLTIDEGRDVAAHWRLRVTGSPGVAGAVFRAASGTHATTATQDMSVRPAAPALTTVATAIAARGGTAELPVDRVLYSELRDVEASAATSPLGLVPGLSRYLTTYPHLCTEQLVSAALPGLVLGTHAEELGIDPARAEALFERARLTLQARQNSDGDFGIWSADANTDPFITAYATHYLIEARARGRAVPDGMLRRALSALAQNLEPSDDLFELRTKSYGLYLLTRSGQVKLAEARALRDVLVALPAEQWNGSVAALFLAAVFKQLNLEDDAKPLLAGVALGRRGETDYDDFDDPLSRDGLTLYLLSKHFPDRARALPPDALLALGDEVAKFNTFSAGTVILGLDAYAQAVPPTVAQNLRISAIGADGTAQPLTTTGSVVLSAAVPEGAKSIRFEASGGTPLFHQLVQAGFDRTPQTVKVANGLEVARELRLAGGKAAVAKAGIHDKLDVVVSVRATDGVEREVAVVDLLPGGFEVDLSSDALLQRRSLVGGDDVWEPQYVDAREDRVAFYGTVGDRARRFVYRIKPTNRGHFQVPPVQIEGMYDRGAWGRGAGSGIDVTD